jgi:hypothetical protein
MEEEFIKSFIENRKFYMNELYTELEAYMEDMRQRSQTLKGNVYNVTEEVFINNNHHKASEAMDLMRWLKKFVETDTNKLECL